MKIIYFNNINYKLKHEQSVYKHCIYRIHNIIILFGVRGTINFIGNSPQNITYNHEKYGILGIIGIVAIMIFVLFN